jgi:hypothetical protein
MLVVPVMVAKLALVPFNPPVIASPVVWTNEPVADRLKMFQSVELRYPSVVAED